MELEPGTRRAGALRAWICGAEISAALPPDSNEAIRAAGETWAKRLETSHDSRTTAKARTTDPPVMARMRLVYNPSRRRLSCTATATNPAAKASPSHNPGAARNDPGVICEIRVTGPSTASAANAWTCPPENR